MNIDQAAKSLGMTPRAIRFYESKGLIAPAKEAHNGYRLFTDADMWRLQLIDSLRQVGLSLDDIKRMLIQLDEGGGNSFKPYLEAQRGILFHNWVGMRQVLVILDRMIRRMDEGGDLALADLIELARQSKHIREVRDGWKEPADFDGLASRYDELLRGGEHGENGEDYERVLETVAEWMAPKRGEKGLDAATGTGNLAGKLIRGGAAVTAIDQSEQMLLACRSKYPSLELKRGNLLAIPFFDGTFDFAASTFAFRHLTPEQITLAAEELGRVLKPQGRLCIADLPDVAAMVTATLKTDGWIVLKQSITARTDAVFAVKPVTN